MIAPTTPAVTPRNTTPRMPRQLPPGVEIYLTNDPRGQWRGELHDGRRQVEVRGDGPEAVVADLVRLYQGEATDPLFR
jgi:hypothetical protein